MNSWGSPKQVALYLSVSEKTILELIRKGLPHIRLNRKTIRIEYAMLNAFLIQRFGKNVAPDDFSSAVGNRANGAAEIAGEMIKGIEHG